MEIQRLLKAGLIQEVRYTTWLVKIVMVRKASRGWRLCVDFTVLNVACSEDNYLLPSIDDLVDKSSGCKLISFMDVYLG